MDRRRTKTERKRDGLMKASRTLVGLLLLAVLAGCATHDAATRPSPERETVVLAHGLGRSAVSMWLENLL